MTCDKPMSTDTPRLMSEEERWEAFARVILEKVLVNGEPALEFIERVMIALPPYPDRTNGDPR